MDYSKVLGISASDENTAHSSLLRAYEEHREQVYRHLVILGAPPAIAQELTQDGFLRLFVALRKGQEIQNPRAWLATVTTNLWLSDRRSAASRLSVLEADLASVLPERAEPGTNPEALLLLRERNAAVRRALAGLTPSQKLCLHLRTKGLRYREIAKITGVSVATVGVWLDRAIETIRKEIYEV